MFSCLSHAFHSQQAEALACKKMKSLRRAAYTLASEIIARIISWKAEVF
jgi:hypothetical protein